MANSTLGKYLRIGNEVVDPLQLADSANSAQDIVNTWFLKLCMIEVGEALEDFIDKMNNETSGRKPSPSLEGYSVEYKSTQKGFIVDVVPSEPHKSVNLNIFNLLDRGNGDEVLVPKHGKPFRFRRYSGNLINSPNSTRTNPISFQSVTVSDDEWVSTYAVHPYDGKDLSARIINTFDKQNVRTKLRSMLGSSPPKSVNEKISSQFKDLFGNDIDDGVGSLKKRLAYVFIRVAGGSLIDSADCKLREEDR